MEFSAIEFDYVLKTPTWVLFGEQFLKKYSLIVWILYLHYYNF